MSFLKLIQKEKQRARLSKATAQDSAVSFRTQSDDPQQANHTMGYSLGSQEKCSRKASLPPVLPLKSSRRGQLCEEHRLPTIPTIYYIPNWITEEEEETIVQCVKSEAWTTLRTRRLQRWGGEVTSRGLVNITEMPPWLEAIGNALVDFGVTFRESNNGEEEAADVGPNHVLINEYQPYQGILGHTDGPLYHPKTATLSLGSDAIMTFKRSRLREEAPEELKRKDVNSPDTFSIILERRSLVVFSHEAYTSYLHSVEPDGLVLDDIEIPCIVNLPHTRYQKGDVLCRDLRYSLTFRRVPVASCH